MFAYMGDLEPGDGDATLLLAGLTSGVDKPWSLPSSSVEVTSHEGQQVSPRPFAVKGSDELLKKEDPLRRRKGGTDCSSALRSELASSIISTNVLRTTYTGAFDEGDSVSCTASMAE